MRRVKYSVSLILGIFFLVCFLHFTVFVLTHPIPENEPRENIIIVILIIVVSLLLAYFLLSNARKQYKLLQASRKKSLPQYESAFFRRFPAFCSAIDNVHLKGFGTSMHTLHDLKKDGSMVGIQWFTLGYFPILPLYQVRFKILGEKNWKIPFVLTVSTLKTEKLEMQFLNQSLILQTYIIFYLVFIPLIVLPIVLVMLNLVFFRTAFPGPNFWWLILGYLIYGVSIYALWQGFNNRFYLKKSFIKD